MNSVSMIQNTLEIIYLQNKIRNVFDNLPNPMLFGSSEDTEAGDLPGPVTTELP